MSKKNRDRKTAAAPPPAPPPGPITYTTSLKPHPRLLIILSIIFALWVALLLVLYFATIYPTTHKSPLPSGIGSAKMCGNLRT